MATQKQERGGSSAAMAAFTGAARETAVNTTRKRVHVHDGATAGGMPQAARVDVQEQTFVAATAVGSGSPEDPDTLTLDITDGTLDYNPSSYVKFQRFVFEMTSAGDNTGAVTLNINGLGPKALKKYESGSKSDLAAGDLKAGLIYEVAYDGSHFVLSGSGVGGGAVVQTAYSADTTVRSTSSTSFTATSSSISISGVGSGNTLRVTAMVNCGLGDTNIVSFQIRRGTTDITPGTPDDGLASAQPAGTQDVITATMIVEDTGHSGGSVTYNLYWKTTGGTAYLGRSSNNLNTTPSVIWTVEELSA